MNNGQYSRILYSKQSAKCISINLKVFSRKDLEEICFSLNEFIQFSSKINDIDKRIPLLCLSAFNSSNLKFFKVFHSLSEQSADINDCLKRIGTFISSSSDSSSEPINEDVIIKEIIQNYLSLREAIQKAFKLNFCKQRLEIFLFTFNAEINILKVKDFLENQYATTEKVSCLKKLEIINFYKESKMYRLNLMENLTTSNYSHLIEILNVKLNSISIMELMKNWLNDSNMEHEHLHLIFSNKLSPNGNSVIKCDLYERLLNPNENFKQDEFLTLKTKFGSTSNRPFLDDTENVSCPIYKMKVEKFQRLEGVCESLLYGDPKIIKSTSSWRLKWNELEQNSENFLLLSNHLQKNNLALLCRLCPSSELHHSNCEKTSFFLIIPKPLPNSPSPTLLMKSIVTRHILLNDNLFDMCTNDGDELTLDKQKIAKFESCFTKNLEIDDVYNPLAIDDNLKPTI